MLTVDSAESVFRRSGKTIALYTVKPAVITIRPTLPNPNRVLLYRSSGKNGLSCWYYKTDISKVYLGLGEAIIQIHRDDLIHVRQAFRRFTQNAKPKLDKKPGKPFTEYPAPA
jgi:hypothetical protein